MKVKNFNVFLFSFFVDVHTSLSFFSSIVSPSFVTCELYHPWHVSLLVVSYGAIYIGTWSKVYLQFVCHICFWSCNLVMFQCFLLHCALYNMHLCNSMVFMKFCTCLRCRTLLLHMGKISFKTSGVHSYVNTYNHCCQ